MAPDPARDFAPLRTDLIGLAYRMTGSLATAEDIAQDAFLRWNAADRAAVELPRAWLLKATARLSLDHLRSARHRREHYVGPWLPEPVPEEWDAPQQIAHERAQNLSVAFLLTLQRLSPVERAVFILHDLFATPFAEIAALLGRGEAACRQIAHRARGRLADVQPRPAVPEDEAIRIACAFHAAAQEGREDELRDLLAADAVLHTDGGGLRPAALHPVLGAEKVGRFYTGLARKRAAPAPLVHLGRINGLPGLVTMEADGLPQVTTLDVRDGRVAAIYVQRNPDKLGWIRRWLARGPHGLSPCPRSSEACPSGDAAGCPSRVEE